MRSIALSILTLFMLASCTKQGATLSSEANNAPGDSAALHVAVVPTLECLPFYYAQQIGLYDSLDVEVRLHEFLSVMDVDTALMNGRVQVGYTFLPRLVMMEREGKDTLSEIAELPAKLYLLTARTKRVRNTKQLKDRMVALERHSLADYWSDQLMLSSALDRADIYRPQFNDVKLRASMLKNQLVDAAILPEPYASSLRQEGNRVVAETSDSIVRLCCLASPCELKTDAGREEQTKRLVAAYNQAVRMLNDNPDAEVMRKILEQSYGLERELTDSLQLPPLGEARTPEVRNRQEAEKWIKERYKKQ